jgi:hypothetical protein
MAEPPGTKVELRRVKRATAVSQKLAALRTGKAMVRAPICAGRMRLLKPACGAVVRTKKSMMVPWMVTRAR